MVCMHALAVALVVAAPGKTKPPTTPPAAEDPTAKAKEAFLTGQRFYKEARYADAIAKFEEAYALKPSPVLFYNIGRCHEQLGDVPKALRAYRDYLRMAPDAKDKDTVSDAIANLERRLKEKGLQQLMVFADPPTAIIEVDGKVLGNSPASVELTAGNHKLSVRAEGFEPTERAFVMQTSRATEMTINLRPMAAKPMDPPPPPPPLVDAPKKDEPKVAALTPTKDVTGTSSGATDVTKPAEPAHKGGRLWTWVAGGAAVAAAGAGVGMGFAAQEAAGRTANPPPGVTPAQQAANAQGLATGANVAYGVAGAAAVAAVVLFFIEGR
ncbi:MAG: PEGA domain-containing protein [Myxococcaceae bacterium]|nr:PEGA domain-containing protein [Myxococcaceae bacterium]